MTDIGRAGMVMKGNYNSTSTYETLDAVSYNNALYVAKQNVPVNTIPTNTTYWQSAIDASLIIGGITARTPQNISNNLSNLIAAVAEQNLEKYGYKIGDYFMGISQASDNFKYWLADMDTFYGGYDYYATESEHHIALVVDTVKDTPWHSSNDISSIKYNESTLHSLLSTTALNIIKADMVALFGGSTGLEHLLGHTKLWNGINTWDWSDANTHSEYISALTEMQLVGSKLWSYDNFQQGEGHKQLSIFSKYCYSQIFNIVSVWLRSMASGSAACSAQSGGNINSDPVARSYRAIGLILFH